MKKILLTIFIFLFVNAVYAGEAWVLWEKNTESGIPSEWKIVTAYPEYKQCIERQKKDFEIIKKGYPSYKIQVSSPETITIEKSNKDIIVISLKCLPDSIDPRDKGVLPKK
jgi:hypothetical protein